MKISVIDRHLPKDNAFMFYKVFADKELLFDFLNSYFEYINYGYKIIDGKVTTQIIKEEYNGEIMIGYDSLDKVLLNLGGKYLITTHDITFEKIIKK